MSRETTTAADADETVLAAQASFDGKLDARDVAIHGRFQGELKASGLVRIFEGANVDGRIDAERVEIGGRFQGDVSSKKLRLVGNARASGTPSPGASRSLQTHRKNRG